MYVSDRAERSADPIGVEKQLVVEQVMTDAVGFLSGVNGSPDLPKTPVASPLFGAADGGNVLGGMEADQVKGVAQAGVTFLGQVADAAEVTAFFRDDVETGKGPDLFGVVEAAVMAEMGQVAGGQ